MEWVQTLVTVVGILVAALVAVRVSAKQHDRQVLHQTKKDVAEALVTVEGINQIFFEVKTMAEFTTGDTEVEEHDHGEIREAVESLTEPIQKLASLTQLLELTAPELIARHGRNLLNEVRGFRTLMMTSLHAYGMADIKRRLGDSQPLGRLTTQAEYEAKYASVQTAVALLAVATKNFEIFTSRGYRIKSFFRSLWFRTKTLMRNGKARQRLVRVVRPESYER